MRERMVDGLFRTAWRRFSNGHRVPYAWRAYVLRLLAARVLLRSATCRIVSRETTHEQ